MRLFVALEPPAAVRRSIVERVASVRDHFPAATWVRERNLHLTLLFLGELDDRQVAAAERALAETRLSWSGEPVRLGAAGTFPERGALRVVWLAVEPASELSALAATLRASARGAGLPFDAKPFRAHLTVARCRRPWPPATRSALESLTISPSPGFAPERVSLLSSVLGKNGPTYSTVAELAFAEAA